MRILCEQMGRGHQHAGSADAALRAAAFKKRGLYRVELVAVCNAFDGANLRSIGFERGNQATVDDRAVYQHRACAAFALAAAFFRAGQMHLFADYVEQARHRIRLDAAPLAVDHARDADFRDGFRQARQLPRSVFSSKLPSALPALLEFR